MCSVKAPKPPKDSTKPVQYVRNPYLDGLAIQQATGRNSLRIDLTGSGPASTAQPATRSPVGVSPPTRIPTPVTGGRSSLAIPSNRPGYVLR